jgi:hypothetical protein
MDALSRKTVDQLAEDISFVKKAIEKNSSILQQIDFRSSLRLVSLLTSTSIFFFCGLFHLLIKHFGTFSSIPTSVKAISISAIALVTVIIGFLKNSGILKSARASDPGISLVRLIKEYYSFRMYHHFVPMALVFLFACAYSIGTGNGRLLIPLLSISAGLNYNSLDTFLRMDDFLLTNYWLIVTGCIVWVFNTISPLLSISITLGCGMLLLSAIWYLPHKKRVEG